MLPASGDRAADLTVGDLGRLLFREHRFPTITAILLLPSKDNSITECRAIKRYE